MEKEQIYEEIAKKLSAKVKEGDDLVVKYHRFGVDVISTKHSLICGYMLNEIYIISREYNAGIYVSVNSGKPYVAIHG